MVSIRNLDS